MVPVLLVHSGFVAVFLGVVCLIAPLTWVPISAPSQALLLIALGLLISLLGILLPATEERAATPKTHLDELVPAWQFREFHSSRIQASRSRVFRAIREVTSSEILFFRTLTWLRRFGRRGPESILDAPERRPLLDVATSTSFAMLADDHGRELVVGTLVITPGGTRRGAPAASEEFKALRAPGFAKGAMNFTVDEDGPGCVVSTETRVCATDPKTRRRFAAYWRTIYPGSALIRRMWLRAIRRRAEVPAPSHTKA